MSHSGFPLPFPNAAPLVAKSAKLSDSQRDALAQTAGPLAIRPFLRRLVRHLDFPDAAGPAPFTLRNFPTRFPDVRSKPLNIADVSMYKEFPIKERVQLADPLRCPQRRQLPVVRRISTATAPTSPGRSSAISARTSATRASDRRLALKVIFYRIYEARAWSSHSRALRCRPWGRNGGRFSRRGQAVYTTAQGLPDDRVRCVAVAGARGLRGNSQGLGRPAS